MEKLIKYIEHLKSFDVAGGDVAKKKECRIILFNLTELMCNPSLQIHKDFVNNIGPCLATLIKLCDSPDSDIRLASDEGLSKVIKALLQLHSNRVLVELCRQIKRTDNSPRVLKLCMNRFGELCHYTRPQKRRAYLANLLNAISAVAGRKEEILHESLALFVQKVFTVMGAFAYENETKTLLKLFLSNLSSESSVIRRCASSSISVITVNNRKADVMLVLVMDFLIGQIVNEDNQSIKSPVVIGTFLTLKMLLAIFHSDKDVIGGQQMRIRCIQAISACRIIQIFELCLHYSSSRDHNVVNAALEALQQVLKMHDKFKSAFAALLQPQKNQYSGALSSSSTAHTIGQWNLTPLLPAEESHLLENEVQLPGFETHNLPSVELDETPICTFRTACLAEESQGTATCQDTSEVDGINSEQVDLQDQTDSDSNVKIIDEECSPLIFCSRHLALHFLLTDTKGTLKPDREVRVSVKNLAMNCLFHLGTLEPEIWNTPSPRSLAEKGVHIVDVLQYSQHDDPQLRGQAALLAASMLKSQAIGQHISTVSIENLLNIIVRTLDDKETAACRFAIQGLELCMAYVLESDLCALMAKPLNSLLSLASNSYWLVRVELLDLLKTLSWSSLQYGMHLVPFQITIFQKNVIDSVIAPLIGDEDHRVRSAVANCLVGFVRTWTHLETKPQLERIKRLNRDPIQIIRHDLKPPSVATVSVPVNGLTKCFEDVRRDEDIAPTLTMFIDKLLTWLVTSDSKFTKMGCIQSLAALVSVYPPSCYPEAYECDSNAHCGLLKLSMSLVSNSTYMLDLPTHQSLLFVATQILAGCIKLGLTNVKQSNRDQKSELKFLSAEARISVYNLLAHVARVLNVFCCVVEDLNPQTGGLKSPLVTLPNPSSLSPIRRKSKTSHTGESISQEKEEKFEESHRKWNKPIQLLNPNNLGHFAPITLYTKLFDLLKSTYSTYKLNLDASTTERLSGFLQSTLDALAVILEVFGFDDIGKFSEEILNYLRLTIFMEPAPCLRAVQQLLKSLFGANLSALWCDEASRVKLEDLSTKSTPTSEKSDFIQSFWNTCRLTDKSVSKSESDAVAILSRAQSPSMRPSPSFSREKRAANVTTKFRTVGKMGPDKMALSSYIRIFEPMVVKALKLYTVTSSVDVQKHVLDLLCELIHLCVNYCLLDADQVFLNFVIQQFEFLEEGFIPDIEILLPSMFRFLSLLSYDRYHSKTIISIPRIMQLSGGLMATGKDVKTYVLPTLAPIVEDLFLSKERMNDNPKELETQKEVLINMLLRLINHHKVYPLLSVILNQTLAESVVKWKSLSKQICDVIVPHLQKRSIDLESMEALNLIHTMLSQLDPSSLQESLFGMMQTFEHSVPDDTAVDNYIFHRTLACQITVIEAIMTVFDESFLMDCLNELNLSYLVNHSSDPLNVTSAENVPPECILANLLSSTLKTFLSQLITEQTDHQTAAANRWTPDESSFLALLIAQFIFGMKKMSDPVEFPRMNSAILMKLNEESNRTELTKLADRIVSYNPLVAIRVYELVGVDCSVPSAHLDAYPLGSFDGLNCNLGKMGQIFLACRKLGHDTSNVIYFVNVHARNILSNWDDSAITNLAARLTKDCSAVEVLINFCLRQEDTEFMVQFSLSLIGMLDKAFRLGSACNADILQCMLDRFQSIPHEIVHKRLSKLILAHWNQNSHDRGTDRGGDNDAILQILDKVDQSTLNKYYAKLRGAKSPCPEFQSQSAQKTTIDKACFMEIASKRHITSHCCRTIEQLTAQDVVTLSSNRDWLLIILKDYEASRPDLFVQAKDLLFKVMSGDIANSSSCRNDKMMWAAVAVCRLLESPHSNLEAVLNESDVRVLAKLGLLLLAEVKEVTASSLHLLRSAARIAKLGDQISREWSRIELYPIVQTALSALIDLISALRNGRTLPKVTLTGLEDITAIPNYSECISNIIQLVSSLESYLENVPKNLLKHLEHVIVGLCRMPLFYAYAIVPPSIWEQISWTPSFRTESVLAVDLPVVPSDLLHDELALKEFVFRIDKLGWISRQKFEEIWMSILGILNLNDDAQFMPEEEACVIQASCAAARALTMLLERNLPHTRLGLWNYDAQKFTKEISEFMQTHNGQKLGEIYSLIDRDTDGLAKISCPATSLCIFASYSYLQHNVRFPTYSLNASTEQAASINDNKDAIDTQSCVHFLVDLYTQWIQNPNTPYALLVEVFRSLTTISDFFTECQQFSLLLELSLTIQKDGIADDPPCLEPSLILCILKSISFLDDVESDTWESVKKIVEISMSSPYISTRSSVLLGLLSLLQKLDCSTDGNRNNAVVSITMDYVAKYLGSDQVGPDWHHSLLWTMAFYAAEHSPDLAFRSTSVVEYLVHSALNAILDGCKIPSEIQILILQGLERLCVMERLGPSLRRSVKKEIINIIRNIDRHVVFRPALKTLLALVYIDIASQLHKPGADPETMLTALEWVGVLFQRMKRGTDYEVDLLGRIMPIVTCDVFPPADILNRLLAEFMSASRPLVAVSLTPTIFRVFSAARTQGQQPLVLEWILMILANFTRMSSDEALVATWNHLCFFTAASCNPWLRSVFSLVSRPINESDPFELDVFVAAAMDFQSQLDEKQRKTFDSTIVAAKEKSRLFSAVHSSSTKSAT